MRVETTGRQFKTTPFTRRGSKGSLSDAVTKPSGTDEKTVLIELSRLSNKSDPSVERMASSRTFTFDTTKKIKIKIRNRTL